MLKECMMFFVIKSSGIESTMEICSNTFLTTQKFPQVFNYCASPVSKRLCSTKENVQGSDFKGNTCVTAQRGQVLRK